MEKVIFQDLGRISYKDAWDYQKQLQQQLIGVKRQNRIIEQQQQVTLIPQQHYLLFCEHPPVYTLGRSGSIDHLLLSETKLEKNGFEFFKTNRGGDITYHGPGQIVGYPIFDLDCFFTDIRRYISYLEEAVMLTLQDYDIPSMREEGYTGVWLPATGHLPKRKICAIGVNLSRWVTMHGFAFNVNTTLSHFDNIIPCGIQDQDKSVTSMKQELGQTVEIATVKQVLQQHLQSLFGFEFV